MTPLEQVDQILSASEALPLEERVTFLNSIRECLHMHSPFKSHPVDCVLWAKGDSVVANDYNPNVVAPPEMALLEVSILSDGYTQPIVAWRNAEGLEVIDGFHRNRVGKESAPVKETLFGYLPVVVANADRVNSGDRMASTIRHNRARGKHKITAMAEIVRSLAKRNWSNEKIGKELGMDPDEVLRFRQIGGLAELFGNTTFSQAWEVEV